MALPPLPAAEFGLPVYSQAGSRAAAVRSVSPDLQVFVQHAEQELGVDGVLAAPLFELVQAFRGWNWKPSPPDCPVGKLCYEGDGPLPRFATIDASQATTACQPVPVEPSNLPAWQQMLWQHRPLNVELFARLLQLDADRGFLLPMIEHGVMLLADSAQLQPFDLPNYPSALEERERLGVIIQEEIERGWITEVSEPPQFVHPLGVVPKPSSNGIRVIHDHSVPVGQGLNFQQVYVRYTWDSLDSALAFFVPHVYMARLDISAYYRHFLVHPSQWQLQSFQFEGKYYVDSRLQFGARNAPEIAHRVTMAIKRILFANGIPALCCVMDDYLFFHCNQQVCRVILAVAIALLQDLGFEVNLRPGKTVEPAESQKFLGVVLNSARMTLSLPADKLSTTLSAVCDMLGRRTVSKKALQSLHGRLQWASRVVYGGKAFLRAISDGLSSVVHPGHHISLSGSIKADLWWWQRHSAAQNGVLRVSPTLTTHYVYTDACLAPVPCVGIFHAGGFASFDASQLAGLGLSPPLDSDNINLWECFAVLVALVLFPDVFRASRVVVYCDNAASVAWITGGSPRPAAARTIVQRLFEMCVHLHIRLNVVPIEGMANVLADAVSRRQWGRFGPLAAAALGCESEFLSGILPSLQA